MKKVLVTGGSGFIGSHIIDKLLKLKIRVTAIDVQGLKEEKIWVMLEHVCCDFSYLKIDIAHFNQLASVFNA